MAEQQEQISEKASFSLESIPNWLIIVAVIIGWVGFGFFKTRSDGSTGTETPVVTNTDASAIESAEQIIRNNMRSPDSYQRRSASVVWRGSTQAGKPAFGVKVDYNGQNGFGAVIRNCEYVFYFKDGDNIRWQDGFGREPCTAIQYFESEAELAGEMGKRVAQLK